VTPGNNCGAEVAATFALSAGSLSQIGSTTSVAVHGYTTAPSFSVSGNTFNVRINALATNTTDTQCQVEIYGE
jgi:hypothetical protein